MRQTSPAISFVHYTNFLERMYYTLQLLRRYKVSWEGGGGGFYYVQDKLQKKTQLS